MLACSEEDFRNRGYAGTDPNLRSKAAICTSAPDIIQIRLLPRRHWESVREDLRNDLNTMRLLLETLCVRDLRVCAELLGGEGCHSRYTCQDGGIDVRDRQGMGRESLILSRSRGIRHFYR